MCLQQSPGGGGESSRQSRRSCLAQCGEILLIVDFRSSTLGRSATRSVGSAGAASTTVATVGTALTATESAFSAIGGAVSTVTFSTFGALTAVTTAFSAATSSASSATSTLTAARVREADVDVEELLAANTLRVLGRVVNNLLFVFIVILLFVEDERLLPLRVVFTFARFTDVKFRLLALTADGSPLIQSQFLRALLLHDWSSFLAFLGLGVFGGGGFSFTLDNLFDSGRRFHLAFDLILD